MDTRYNLTDNYTQMMNEKTLQYNNLVRNAEITNRDNNGTPTKEEGLYYLEASKKAAEIANLNLSQPAVKAQWLYRKQDCEEKVKAIASVFAPPPPPVSPADNAAGTPLTVRETLAGPDGNGVTTTKSGFKTKNASKDVPAETIEGWWNDNGKENLPTFEDIAGLQEVKDELKGIIATIGLKNTIAEIGANPTKAYFFYGAPGTGKTFIVNAFAGEMRKKGYKYLHLVGGDIHSSLVGVAEKIVAAAFREAIDNAPCVLFFDEFEELCKNRSAKAEGHEKRLTNAFLEAYNELVNSKAPVILLAAANYPTQVDEAMMSRFTTRIKFPLPDHDARLNFFDKKRKNMNLDESVTNEKLVEITENYSYRSLDSVVEKVKDSILIEAYKKYRVVDADGNDDVEKTDEAIRNAIASDKFKITPESFYKTFASCSSAPNKNILEDIEKFEASF